MYHGVGGRNGVLWLIMVREGDARSFDICVIVM